MQTAKALATGGAKRIRYLPYDWSLNAWR